MDPRKKYPNGTLVRVLQGRYKYREFQNFMDQFVGLVGVVSGILPEGEIEVTFKDDHGPLQMCFDDCEIEIVHDKHSRFLYEMYGAQMGRFEFLFSNNK